MIGAEEAERLARAALCRLAEPGDPRLSALVAAHGAIPVRDRLVAGMTEDGLLSDPEARMAVSDPGRDLEVAARGGFTFLVPGDPSWPASLAALDSVEPVQRRGGMPMGLWVRGQLPDGVCERGVAIVGSRSATTYGTEVAGSVAAGLAREGLCVISGAAFGIDQAAHRGAIAESGPTVAVLACGVDRVYPEAHRGLIDYIAGVGAVVSELPPGCAPTRFRFLSRNRLIAALAAGTVVVEAAIRSGALNTANWADRLSRRLMGVPGQVTSAQSQGVHQLIRSGAATLVTDAADVLEQLGRPGEHLLPVPRGPVRRRDRLTLREQQVLDAVPVVRAAGSDSIARAAGVEAAEVAATLERLGGEGLVVRTQAGWHLADSAD